MSNIQMYTSILTSLLLVAVMLSGRERKPVSVEDRVAGATLRLVLLAPLLLHGFGII